jgi:hypothetical protein
MAEAKAIRPEVVGNTLNEIAGEDPRILSAVLEVMETENLLDSDSRIDLVPEGIQLIV